jgi:hypothetical protein
MQIPLTVSGIDAKGHIFRERTVVQGLDGRDCQYQSKHEVRVDSVVLLDLDYSGTGQEPRRVQGRVKSLRTPRTDPGLFQIDVELDALQSLKIVANDQESPARKEDTPMPGPFTVTTEPKGTAAPRRAGAARESRWRRAFADSRRSGRHHSGEPRAPGEGRSAELSDPPRGSEGGGGLRNERTSGGAQELTLERD